MPVARAGITIAVLAFAPFAASCSGSDHASCLRSGDSQICLVSAAAGGWLEVSGLRPGSTLDITFSDLSTQRLQINEAGSIDGKVGVLNGLGGPVELTVSGTSGSGELLVGTLEL